MEKELEELIQARKEMDRTHEKNGFTSGIHRVVTELYPNTAHFIYELLQNAEDMCATTVRFVLNRDCMKFEHNGTKRSFNIADIRAITSIGDNIHKKQDFNSIGKFGVGFKAVLYYTSTPIIHSGKYHFKIVNDFVPEFEDVQCIPTLDSEGVEWTKFEFPFNCSSKKPNVAYQECLKGLKTLDKSTVLFLRNIRKVEYSIDKTDSHDFGYVERTGNDDGLEGAHIITINEKSCETTKILTSNWLKFHRIIEIVDEQGFKKNLPIAVAYALKSDKKTSNLRIEPIKGKVFIYFIADKETSNLRFHINAPFASTVARDCIRDCVENNNLMDRVAQLIGESLDEIKRLNLMNQSFFAVLPNNRDELTPLYSRIFKDVCLAFQKNEYLPTKDEKSFVSSTDALLGPVSISHLFTQKDLSSLFGLDKKWICNVPKDSPQDFFLQSLGVESFTYEDFCKAFETEVFQMNVNGFLSEKDKKWLTGFYDLCITTKRQMRYDGYSFVQNLGHWKIIRCTDERMRRPADVYILPDNCVQVTTDAHFVDEYFVGMSQNSDPRNSDIRSFFLNDLNIRTYGPKVEIEKRLSRYQQCFDCYRYTEYYQRNSVDSTPQDFDFDDTYFEDMLAFAKYYSIYPNPRTVCKNMSLANTLHYLNTIYSTREANNYIDFTRYRLFVYVADHEGKMQLRCECASSLYLGKSYGYDEGEELAKALDGNLLWDEYAKRYSPDDLRIFLDFAKVCGIKYELTIEHRDAQRNPLFREKLSSERRLGNSDNNDYIIPKLGNLLNKNLRSISKMIWDCLLKNGNDILYCQAYYRPNQQVSLKRCDSTLVYELKRAKWIPVEGSDELYAPEDVSIEDLPSDFRYEPGNHLLQALKLGSNASPEAQLLRKAEAILKKIGYVAIPVEKYKEFEKWESLYRNYI